ncbi:MAG: PaaI family thioesterase [Bryobacteraceae bacterium]|nr:PaaI family thioesterase [Bryobacteraceae bacterium]MDW8377014.1 PaaI family thioesterase [Bryobacterales bacterium]
MNFTEWLGIRVVEESSEGVAIEIDTRDFYFNPDGSLHGGLIATLVDECVWFAMERSAKITRSSTTVELKVNYLRPLKNSTVARAKARLVKTGRTLCTGTVEVSDERGALCAIGIATYMLLDNRQDNPLTAPAAV